MSAIRRELDGKGGQQAVQDGFKDWLLEAAKRFRAPDLPIEIQEPVLRLWDTANTLAARCWEADRAALGRRVDALEAQVQAAKEALAQSQQEAERLEGLAAEQAQSLGDTRDALEAAERDASRLRQDLADTTRALADAAAARDEQARQRSDVEGILAEARAGLSHAQERLATLRRDLDVANARSTLLEKAEATALAAAAQARDDLAAARANAEQLTDTISRRDAQIARLTETIQAEQQARDADTDHWTALIEDVRSQLRESKERERGLSAEKKALSDDLRRKEAQIARFARENRASDASAVGGG